MARHDPGFFILRKGRVMKQFTDDLSEVELVDFFDQWCGPLKRFIDMADKSIDDERVTVQQIVEPAKIMMETFRAKMHAAFSAVGRDVGRVYVNVANADWLEGDAVSASVELVPPVRSEATQ